jgi:hypothetical protein
MGTLCQLTGCMHSTEPLIGLFLQPKANVTLSHPLVLMATYLSSSVEHSQAFGWLAGNRFQ